MMKIIGIIFLIMVLVELFFRPRFDYTREGWILLWYGRKHRNYIKIIHIGSGSDAI